MKCLEAVTLPRGGIFTAIQVPWVSSSLCQAGVKAPSGRPGDGGSMKQKRTWAAKSSLIQSLFGTLSPRVPPSSVPGAADLGFPCFSEGCSCDFTSARSSVTVRPILIAARELQTEADFQKLPAHDWPSTSCGP